ncbi:MAG: GspE/PulE family protein [Pseudomonadota bacterium]
MASDALVPYDADPHDLKQAEAFLQLLRDRSHIDDYEVSRATAAVRQSGQRFDVVLLELGLIDQHTLSSALAAFYGLDYEATAVDTPVWMTLEGVERNALNRFRLVPLRDDDHTLHVAAPDPFAADAVRSLAYLTKKRIRIILRRPAWIDEALAQFDSGSTNGVAASSDNKTASAEDVRRLRDLASDAPVVRLVSRLLSLAAQHGASDIHFEPFGDRVRVRFRIDGVTRDVEWLAADLEQAVVSRIKILAGLDIAERRLPQDGRAHHTVAGRNFDLRVSTIPVRDGESAVIRLLASDQGVITTSELGFDSFTTGFLDDVSRLPNGVVLVTGPTGSGKTTTLFSVLSRINTAERTLFTIEDPVEYRLRGVNQVQINAAIGLDFASSLRSILRQDPDVVMIGEMRDHETAEIALRAALTGHLVLSTMHTNSAVGAVTRLRELGLPPFLISGTLSGVIAQRLCRTLCDHCAEPCVETQQWLSANAGKYGREIGGIEHANCRRAVGCSHCAGSGYIGRSIVAETLVIDEATKDLILNGASERAIAAKGQENGMTQMAASAVLKVASGETSLAEIQRCVRL